MKSGKGIRIYGNWAVYRHFSEKISVRLGRAIALVLVAAMTISTCFLLVVMLFVTDDLAGLLLVPPAAILIWWWIRYPKDFRRFVCVALNKATGDIGKLKKDGSQIVIDGPLSRFSRVELRHFPLHQLPNWMQLRDWQAWLVLENGNRTFLTYGSSKTRLYRELSPLIRWLGLPVDAGDNPESIALMEGLFRKDDSLWRRCDRQLGGRERERERPAWLARPVRMVGIIASPILALFLLGALWSSVRDGVSQGEVGVLAVMFFMGLLSVVSFFSLIMRNRPKKVDPCEEFASKLDETCG